MVAIVRACRGFRVPGIGSPARLGRRGIERLVVLCGRAAVDGGVVSGCHVGSTPEV